ncbi:spermidine synthase [uncultured Jannaschia sp.]|uniref:spermidine synthase n=1 Tax=uncultured Jannaschia sp. TaxID=293347 RepID=UPI00260389EC|nr:spermidine synthase [uncultured Jannaschia sp.]
MRPWIERARADAPDGDTLRLMQRGDEFSIRIAGGNELMNSRLGGSEEALARLALDHLDSPAPRILIGGLGMGFTLREAQGRLGPDARITVAEIVPDLAVWARDDMADLFDGCLDDPRVTLDLRDVRQAIAEGGWDAILLDVDNGPDGLTRPGNDALYSETGLRASRAALAPGGVLAVWSAHPAPAFTRRMETAGFDTATETVRAGRGRRGPKHVIWIGRR